MFPGRVFDLVFSVLFLSLLLPPSEPDLLKKLHYPRRGKHDTEDGGTVNPANSIEKVNGNGHHVEDGEKKTETVVPTFPELPKDTPV